MPRRTVVLVAADALDVNDPLLAVNLDDLAVLVLAVHATTLDDNLVTLADWHGLDLRSNRVFKEEWARGCDGYSSGMGMERLENQQI